MSELLSFEKLHNTRDLGGTRTRDGRIVSFNMLIRSGHLADITEEDKKRLASSVRTIVDFRTAGERRERPDQEIPGAVNIHIPIVESLTAGISREEAADREVFRILILKPVEAKEYMCEMYRAFVDDYAVSQYRCFLRILLEAEECVLWHCTAGKDRAGIASILVEEILGVDRNDIFADYLATNEFLEKDVRHLTAFMKEQYGADSPLADESLGHLLGARAEYVESFYAAAEKKFGSFDGFLWDGLGIGDSEKDIFCEKYLEAIGSSNLL